MTAFTCPTCGKTFPVVREQAVSERVRRLGYRLASCNDLYVHHFGTNLTGR
jgi:hypothetical protein